VCTGYDPPGTRTPGFLEDENLTKGEQKRVPRWQVSCSDSLPSPTSQTTIHPSRHQKYIFVIGGVSSPADSVSVS
jgi:hypothetical protein